MRHAARTLLVLATGVVLVGGLPGPTAGAAVPGTNGVIVFSSQRPNAIATTQSDLYVINPDGTGLTRLTNSPRFDLHPDFSPDGSTIAFSSSSSPYAVNLNSLWVIGSDGTGLTKIGRKSKDEPAWSPDGTRIAYVEGAFNDAEIWTMNPDGTHRDQLTFSFGVDASPAWSPDGTKIAFVRSVYPDDIREIWVMNADGTNQVPLTSNGYDHESLDWSPDGTKIAFNYYRRGSDIGYIPATGGDEVFMIGGSHGFFEPSWSPDGAKIAFVKSTSLGSTLYIANINGTGMVRLLRRSVASPDWQAI